MPFAALDIDPNTPCLHHKIYILRACLGKLGKTQHCLHVFPIMAWNWLQCSESNNREGCVLGRHDTPAAVFDRSRTRPQPRISQAGSPNRARPAVLDFAGHTHNSLDAGRSRELYKTASFQSTKVWEVDLPLFWLDSGLRYLAMLGAPLLGWDQLKWMLIVWQADCARSGVLYH